MDVQNMRINLVYKSIKKPIILIRLYNDIMNGMNSSNKISYN